MGYESPVHTSVLGWNSDQALQRATCAVSTGGSCSPARGPLNGLFVQHPDTTSLVVHELSVFGDSEGLRRRERHCGLSFRAPEHNRPVVLRQLDGPRASARVQGLKRHCPALRWFCSPATFP